MTETIFYWRRIVCVVLCGCTTISFGQETTIRPTPVELQSVRILTQKESSAWKSGWEIDINIFHMDDEGNEEQKKAFAELATSRPSKTVHMFSCGSSAGAQQGGAKKCAPFADVYSYWAYRFGSNDSPAKGELIWGGYDNPYINHARRMRHIIGSIPIIAILHGTVCNRPVFLEEMQWELFASLGCGYRVVVWPIQKYKDIPWGDELKRIGNKIQKYDRSLANAKHVNWVKAEKDQPITALSCERYLFVFLLNKAYMSPDKDGNNVSLPLDKTLCEGYITFTLPAGLNVRWGRALAGNSLRITSKNGKTMSEYSFNSGGEMLIFSLDGRIELPATTQPSNQPSSQTSIQPTSYPSTQPTTQPTTKPTNYPSTQLITQPTTKPTSYPSTQPITQPTTKPTSYPSNQPTTQPTTKPTNYPSTQPTTQPTTKPATTQPTSMENKQQ